MIRVDCHICEKELDSPGAVMITPPNVNVCVKLHVCRPCWKQLGTIMNELRGKN